MERKMIDGMPNSNTLIAQLEAWRHYSYRNKMGAVIGSSLFGINKNSFEALPPDLQQIVLDAGKEMTLAGRNYLKEDDARWDAELPGKGMQTHIVPEETIKQMRELGKSAWIEWAAAQGGLAQEIMDETFKFVGIEP
jgi:TRAP-type C4-dicarboxylate transport system substrate-binding protein